MAHWLKYGAYAGVVVALAGAVWVLNRYAVSPAMTLSLDEVGPGAYAEDPSVRGVEYGHYQHRFLRLFKKSDTKFDFVLEPKDKHVATIAIRDVDVGLMTPDEPTWARGDAALESIALSERQFNRQQVIFPIGTPRLTVDGGDGYETDNLLSAELVKNCLGAGSWEVHLYVKENGAKALYYQGWFTFPLGHYKHVFEHQSGLAYLDHWRQLERWQSPAGTPVNLPRLRAVLAEHATPAQLAADEPLLWEGEQGRKRKNVDARWLKSWKDVVDGRPVAFASFVPPGRYDAREPFTGELSRFAALGGAMLRQVKPADGGSPLAEVELRFTGKSGEPTRLIVSGFDPAALPQLESSDYSRGLYRPLGIGVAPFGQLYDDLERRPPAKSPFFAMLLDDEGRWLDHHRIGIDGVVMHRDRNDPKLAHLYLMAYEREALAAEVSLTLDGPGNVAHR